MAEGDPRLSGTSVFTGERSAMGYRLNRFAATLTQPENRRRFLADERAYMAEHGLADEDVRAVLARDWAAMVGRGGNVYVLLKIAATVGHSLLQMGAQMRGESLEAFMATRRGPRMGG